MTNQKEKIEAALGLLDEGSTSADKFEAITKLIDGLNPDIDKKLRVCARALFLLTKLQNGDFIELSAETLPEGTEKEKKRKKALLFFLQAWKDLKSEVERIEKIANSGDKSVPKKSLDAASSLKGPFGIITIAAVLVVVGIVLLKGETSPNQSKAVIEQQTPVSSSQKASGTKNQKTRYIVYSGREISLPELSVKNGSDCDSPHYHALDGLAVKTLNGEIIQDPGACAFGKVEETSILEKQE